jgi:hypothetical protein
VSQERKSQGRKFIWVGTTVLDIHFLCMSNNERERKSLELEHPWKENSRECWRLSGFFWS